jgi:very-short-patch-repair endonuclease
MALRVNPRLEGYARQMRNEPTGPETRLWQKRRSSQLGGHKFSRQIVIEGAICDFVCRKKALIVEVDGDTHVVEADRLRDARLARSGYRTLRFTNRDVMDSLEGVLTVILSALDERVDRFTHPPTPSLEREGEP